MMSFRTQLRQVLARDVRTTRYLLFAIAGLLLGAALERDRVLQLPPVTPDSWVSTEGMSGVAFVATRLALLALGGALALAFAPRIPSAATGGWRTLPIAPSAVWSARLLWVLLVSALLLATTAFVLQPLPLDGGTVLTLAASVTLGALSWFVASALLAATAGSLRQFVGLVVAAPLTLLLVAVLQEQLSKTWPTLSLLPTLPTTTPAQTVALLVASLGLLGSMLDRRMLGWPVRAAGVLTAVALLLVNTMRSDAPSPLAARAELPPLVSRADVRIALERVTRVRPLDATLRLDLERITDSLRVSGAPMPVLVADQPPVIARVGDAGDSPLGIRLRIETRLAASDSTARLVWRARHLRVSGRTSGDARTLHVHGSDGVSAEPAPSLPSVVRWLNEPRGMALPMLAPVDDPARSSVEAASRAVLTLDVERQRPSLLALLALDGSAASGPWKDHVRLLPRAESPRPDQVWANLLLVRRPGEERRAGIADLADDFTFALVNASRGEALHLDRQSRSITDRVATLAPWLVGVLEVGLGVPMESPPVWSDSLPSRLPGVVDDAWLRGASLAVIGWRTVERGALQLEAPVQRDSTMR
jgi:hypothetical protein